MATRRKAAKDATPSSPPKPSPDMAQRTTISTFLPTALEAALLGLYPGTLLFGSLFSYISPTTRSTPYSPVSQSHPPHLAPSYFARKSNIFNLYFVKIGWLWITAAMVIFIMSHPSLGPPLRPVLTQRRLKAALRYTGITMCWIATTQWFFGPPLIDRGFRFTGGACEVPSTDNFSTSPGQHLTHAACKLAGGQWRGGHDISGHVFLLILGSAMLWLEVLPAVLKEPALREKRPIMMADGVVKSAAAETEVEPASGEKDAPRGTEAATSFGVKLALGVAGFSWWMLLMTAAFFHTWFEKFTGLLVAFTGIYMVYFLPRALPAYRAIVGLPGV